MKKSLLLLMVVLMSLALVAIAISAPINNVSGTKHNLSTSGTGSYKSSNEDQICVFCHTPHQATGISTDPLWNHSLSTKTDGYGMYNSTTFNAGAAPQGQGTQVELSGNGTALSNLCMSCHDGTQAVNSLYNPSNDIGANPTMSNAGFMTTISTNANIGTDLSNDHPVNFTYDTALANLDGGLVDPATVATCVAGNYVTAIGQFVTDYPTATSISAKLTPSNQFQCSSCHGAHIYYGGTQSGYSPFLKVNNVGSGLCLSCHCK